MKRCEQCETIRDDVRRVRDPFRYEITGETVLMDLCPRCLQDRRDDI